MQRKRWVASIILLAGLALGIAILAAGAVWEEFALRSIGSARAECEQSVLKLVDRCAPKALAPGAAATPEFDATKWKVVKPAIVRIVQADPAFEALSLAGREAVLDYFLSDDSDYTKLFGSERIVFLRKFALFEYTGKTLPPGPIVGSPVSESDLPPGYTLRPFNPPVKINPDEFIPDTPSDWVKLPSGRMYNPTTRRITDDPLAGSTRIEFESVASHTPQALAVVLCDPRGIDAPPKMGETLRQERRMETWNSDKWWYFGIIVFIAAIPRGWYFLLARLREISDSVRGMDN
jgi:hypothetical protein